MELTCFGTGSSGNCYLLNMGGSYILLDAGVPIKKINESINLNKIDLCFVSHEHKDHSAELENLRFRGLSIVQGATYQEPTKILKYGKLNRLYGIYDIPVEHGKTPCGALILKNDQECILYATDFNKCKYNLYDFKFTSIIIECNFIERLMLDAMNTTDNEDIQIKYKRQFNTHMGLDGLQKFLNTLDLFKCREIYLVHKSQDEHISNELEMVSVLKANYPNIKFSVCQNHGGIHNY